MSDRISPLSEDILLKSGIWLDPDETFGCYVTEENPYVEYNCIIRKGSDDIASALEDTLHRLKEKNVNDEDIYIVTGMVKDENENEDDYDDTPIDLGYVIRGHILSYHELGNDDFYKSLVNLVKIDMAYDIKKLDELKEHLSMNGYHFLMPPVSTLYVDIDELSYVRTIMDDRDIDYEIDEKWCEDYCPLYGAEERDLA